MFTTFYLAGAAERAASMYGAIGAALTLLLWLFIAARLMVAGAILNSELHLHTRGRGGRLMPLDRIACGTPVARLERARSRDRRARGLVADRLGQAPGARHGQLGRGQRPAARERRGAAGRGRRHGRLRSSPTPTSRRGCRRRCRRVWTRFAAPAAGLLRQAADDAANAAAAPRGAGALEGGQPRRPRAPGGHPRGRPEGLVSRGRRQGDPRPASARRPARPARRRAGDPAARRRPDHAPASPTSSGRPGRREARKQALRRLRRPRPPPDRARRVPGRGFRREVLRATAAASSGSACCCSWCGASPATW